MLAIGRILRTGAKLLLLDEPTEGLAPVIVQQIGRTIARAEERGLHHRAGRAELPLRRLGGGPPLRGRAGPGGRHDPATPSSTPTSTSSTPISASDAIDVQSEEHRRETGHTGPRLGRGLLWPPRRPMAVDVKIGVLNDRSGIYADLSGEGSVVAARMAVEDFDAAAKGINVEIVSADHQNKPDIASNIARQWYDTEGVDVIVDVPTSSAALAVNDITREKNKIFINSGAARLGPDRREVLAEHRPLDLRHLGAGPRHRQRDGRRGRRHLVLPHRRLRLRPCARARHRRRGRGGGRRGARHACAHPFPGQDFSSFLLQAQSSGAEVIGLANAGGDTINAIKQASEFGITQAGQTLAGLLIFITDVHRARAGDRAGAGADRELLLGPQRRHPRLVRALRRGARRRQADHGACRRLRRRPALPEGGRGGRRQGGRGGDGQDEGDADRRPAVRRGRGARRRPQDPRHVPLPGQGAGRLDRPVGLLRARRHHPGRRRPSARSPTAAARWCSSPIRAGGRAPVPPTRTGAAPCSNSSASRPRPCSASSCSG